jgi:TonB-dependent receptor
MKRTHPIALVLAWLGLAITSVHTGWTAESAGSAGQSTTLTGVVTNSATGRALEGARVVLTGTGREERTDNFGAYRFENVTPGSVVLSVSYTGLKTVEVPVTASSGRVTRSDVGLTADIYMLSKYVVSGEREGNAQAITLQRQSNGVKSIVSSDAFGSLGGNPAELVVRLPGVEGETVGGDMRFIRVRGMHQNLLTVTMDGNRVAEATSAGTTREFQFGKTNADTIERIEVVKSPTPDMDGDSIGGNVNMVTKSALDSSPERRVSGSLGASWVPVDEPSNPLRPNFSLSYSEVFGGKLAVAFNGSYRPFSALLGTLARAYEQKPNGSTGPAYTYSYGGNLDFRSKRVRSGGGFKVDYKLSDHIRFSVNLQHNKYDETNNHTGVTWATNQVVATRDANGNLTGTGGIVPGYTATVTEFRPVAASTVTLSSNNLNFRAATGTIQFNGVHRYRKLNIDYNTYKSNSKTNYANTSVPSFIARNIGLRIENTSDAYFPLITQTAGPDLTNISSYTDNSYSITRNATWDGFVGAAFNVKKDFDTPVPTYLKMGMRWREQNRARETNPYTGTLVGPDGVMGVNPATGVNDDNLANYMAYRPMPGKFSRYPNLPFPRIVGFGSPNFYTTLQQTPQYFQQNVAVNLQSKLTGYTTFKEDITAAYLMGNMELGKLSVLGGFRVESTKTDGEGALQAVTPEERARRAAWVGPVTVAEDVRRRTAEFGGRLTRSGEYRVVLPGLHFKYSPVQNIVTRLSYSTNIGRPGPGQLVPTTLVNFENQTVSSSNPSLKPQTANNFDFSAEYYFEPAGMVSAGVFLKEIKQFIYTAGGTIVPGGSDNGFGGEYEGFVSTTQYNGGFAKVKGVELNYSQQFTFLPGWWSGLGAFANVTWLNAEGNYGSGDAISLAPTPKIAGFNPFNANAGISYIRNRVTLRLQLNHRGRYLTTYNVNESRLGYRRARTMYNLKASYTFSKHFDFYFDWINLLPTPENEAENGIGLPTSVNYFHSGQLYFGINARL